MIGRARLFAVALVFTSVSSWVLWQDKLATAAPPATQAESQLAIELITSVEKGGLRVGLAYTNRSARPVTLVETCTPEWMVNNWFKVTIDGQLWEPPACSFACIVHSSRIIKPGERNEITSIGFVSPRHYIPCGMNLNADQRGRIILMPGHHKLTVSAGREFANGLGPRIDLARMDAAAIKAALNAPRLLLPAPTSVQFTLAGDFITTQPEAGVSPGAAQLRATTQPSLDRPDTLDEITFSMPSGWWLAIGPDGGGAMGFGINPVFNFRPLPARLFDFHQVCKGLATSAHPDRSAGQDCAVLIAGKDRTVVSRYTGDQAAVLDLFDRAFKLSKPTKWDPLDEVRKTHPIIQPEAKPASATNPAPPTTQGEKARHAEGLFRYRVADRWGYIDSRGDWVIAPSFKQAGEFGDGLAAVQTADGGWGYIDRTGRLAFGGKYYEAHPFSDGMALVRERSDGKLRYLFVNAKGETLAGVDKYPWVDEQFSEGRIGCRVDDPDGHVLYGFLDSQGAVAVKPISTISRRFACGLALVKIDGKYGYVNLRGELAIQPRFDDAGGFGDGLAPVKVDGKYGCIDDKGKIVIEPMFAGVWSFSEGLAAVWDGKAWAFIDRTGQIKFQVRGKFRPQSHQPFSDGVCVLSDHDVMSPSYSFIDMEGKAVGQFAEKGDYRIGQFRAGLAPVLFNTTAGTNMGNFVHVGYIRKSGERVKVVDPKRPATQPAEKPASPTTQADPRPWGPINNGLQMSAWLAKGGTEIHCLIRNASDKDIRYSEYFLGYRETVFVQARRAATDKWQTIPRHWPGGDKSAGPSPGYRRVLPAGRQMPPAAESVLPGFDLGKAETTFSVDLTDFQWPSDWHGEVTLRVLQKLEDSSTDTWIGTLESAAMTVPLAAIRSAIATQPARPDPPATQVDAPWRDPQEAPATQPEAGGLRIELRFTPDRSGIEVKLTNTGDRELVVNAANLRLESEGDAAVRFPPHPKPFKPIASVNLPPGRSVVVLTWRFENGYADNASYVEIGDWDRYGKWRYVKPGIYRLRAYYSVRQLGVIAAGKENVWTGSIRSDPVEFRTVRKDVEMPGGWRMVGVMAVEPIVPVAPVTQPEGIGKP